MKTISQDAFLRKLPSALKTAERIRFEALVFAVDTLDNNLEAIENFLTGRGSDLENLTPKNLSHLFSSIWSIVDQLHFVNQIAGWIIRNKSKNFFEELMGDLQTSTKIRNKMDHLNANINNLAQSAGGAPPFGSLSYVYVDQRNIDASKEPPTIRKATILTIVSGNIHGNASFSAINPGGRIITAPISIIQFSAFGLNLIIDEVAEKLFRCIQEFNANTEEQLTTIIAREALAKGIDIKDAMSGPMGGVSFAMDIEFEETPVFISKP